MSDDEQLEVVDATGRMLGVDGRRAIHSEGRWHQVVHCLVVRPDPPARVVLQVRTAATSTYPGRLDLSATGHLAAGEAPERGMVREIVEELGIDVDPARLVPLGHRLLAADHGEIRNRELVHVFLLADDRPLTAFTTDPEHAAGVVEIAVDDLLRVLADPSAQAPASTVTPGGEVVARTVRHADLVSPLDGYWTVITVMAARLVAGDRPLAI